jgi:hypothetical protein
LLLKCIENVRDRGQIYLKYPKYYGFRGYNVAFGIQIAIYILKILTREREKERGQPFFYYVFFG